VHLQNDATAQQRQAARQLVELIGGNWATQAIGVAARLGLADRIAEGVSRTDALATPAAARRRPCTGCCAAWRPWASCGSTTTGAAASPPPASCCVAMPR
jgi:hypothetical protein